MANALVNLKSSIDRVRSITADIDANAVAALADPAVQDRHETILCASVVILSGFFESFLREIAEEVVTAICACSIPFGNLPDRVRVTHLWEGARRVSEFARQEKLENPIVLAKASDAARRLASVAGPALPYEIIWEAFAETQANPGPSQISDFLKRFGIEKPVPTLASTMGIGENTLIIGLNSFLGIRNECAHTGSATTNPTSTDVRGYCDLIQNVGTGIDTLFNDLLSKPPYAPWPAPPALGPAPSP
jgi:hypothetical protein